MENFEDIGAEIITMVNEWADKLLSLTEKKITIPRNSQHRSIKQILGHMIDSTSNNTHRVVHLQYREVPLRFPNYASYGNNDKWISIQNYQNENWENLVQLWKYIHYHFVHVTQNINPEKLDNEWLADVNLKITLKNMVEDFPRHFKVHLGEIEELINS